MTPLEKLARALMRSPTERYNAAVDRYQRGERQTKPLPGEFGLQGLRTSPIHKTVDKIREVQPHQAAAVDFIVQHHGQGILAHSTGSGKTITAVKAFDKLKELGKAHKALVITPAGLRTNFLVEGVQRASDHKGSILTGQGERGEGMYHWSTPDPESTYHVVSYEIFREHPEDIIRATGADTLILDEFHRIKDPDRNTFKRLAQVRPLVRNVIGLTGSVISTHPSNILQPIEAVTGGQHGLGTREQFEAKYLTRAPAPFKKRKPVVLSKPSTWANWIKPRERMANRKTEFAGWQNTGELQRHLRQHIHYVGPELVAEKMPEKHVDTVRVEMSPFQEQVYRAALKELPAPLLRKLEEGHPMIEGEQGEVFNRVIKARQAANSVHTLTGLTPEEAAPATPKLQKMLDDIEDHLHQTPDGGVIIYSNLVHGGIDIIRAGLKQRGLAHGLFIGKGNEGVTEETRQKDVQDFKAGKLKVMVVSGAGNEGVSLPNATFHAAYDGHWNPEKILQAEARGWRLGGQAHRPQEQRRVHVRRYMTVWPESRGLMGKVTAYFKGQKESDAVDSWIYNWADKRHNLNAQLHDLLKGEEVRPHSLFAEGRGMYDTPAFTQPVAEPRLDPNYQPPAPKAPKPAPPAPAAPAAQSWWQSWKGASLEGPLNLEGYDTEKLAEAVENAPPTDGLVYFIPHDVSSGFHPEPSHHVQDEHGNWGHFGERPKNHFHHIGVLHGEHAYEKDHTGALRITPAHERIPQLLTDGAAFVHTPLDIEAVHASHPPNVSSEEMVARALKFSLRSGDQRGVLGPSEVYRILLNQPHASEVALHKTAGVVAHIAGLSGAGKSTLMEELGRAHPELVTKDLDEIDQQAMDALHPGRQKSEFSNDQLRPVGEYRQKLLDAFLAQHADRPVLLAGIHQEPYGDFRIPAQNRVMLDTGPLRSTFRGALRNRQFGPFGLGDAWKLYQANRGLHSQLQGAGYQPMNAAGIHALVAQHLGKTASAMDAAIGIGGFEPQGTGQYEAGTPLTSVQPQQKPGKFKLGPAIIVDPGGYVDEHTQQVHAALPWLNKEPWQKAAFHRIRGILEGFPECCIDAFVDEDSRGLAPAMERTKLGWDDDSGYVPCEACYKEAAEDGTPEPQVGDRVKVRLEDRTAHDDFSVVPMGEIPGTINAADGDPWDAIPIDVPLSKVRGTVEGEVIGKIKDRTGNDKLVVKSEPGPLTKRQKQDLQAYQAARQVWAGKMKMQVPGVKDVQTKVGERLFFAHAAMALEKGAGADEEGEVLSVVCRVLDHDKTAKKRLHDQLIPRVNVGHHDALLHIKRDLRGRFAGLNESKHPPHVTLLYAYGLKDAAHPHFIGKVQEHLKGRKLKLRFNRLGTFNNGGRGVIYMVAEGRDLHDTHRGLKGIAEGHGAKFYHPVFKPHLTLFYRDQPFSPAERAEIGRMRIPPLHLERDRSHIDVTLKRGTGWQKVAEEDLEILAGSPELYEASCGLAKRAFGEIHRWRQIPFPLPVVPCDERVSSAWVDLPPGLPFAKASALADEIEEALRTAPEVTGARVTLSKDAGMRVTCDLRESELPESIYLKLAGVLQAVLQKHSGIRLKEANTGVREDPDDTPVPKRWVEPKYRRPAAWTANSTEHSRMLAEYANPGQVPSNLP